jgi:hypothetical protein
METTKMMEIRTHKIENSPDRLTLYLAYGQFAGFKPTDYLEVTYLENINGKEYNSVNTQYFPVSELRKAIAVFEMRVNSLNPEKEAGESFALEDFMEKENAGICTRNNDAD